MKSLVLALLVLTLVNAHDFPEEDDVVVLTNATFS